MRNSVFHRALLGGAAIAAVTPPAVNTNPQRTMTGVGSYGANWGVASTEYFAPLGGVMGPLATGALGKAACSLTWPQAGTFSKIYVKPTFNSRSDGTVWTLYKNGVAAVTFTFSAGSMTQQTDLSTQVANNGTTDTFCVGVLIGAGTGQINFRGASFEFITTSGQVAQVYASNGGSALTAARFISPAGQGTAYSTETDGNYPALEALVLSNLRTGITVYGGTTSVFTSRKQAAAGAQSFTVNATGVFEDTTHSDSFTAGQLAGTSRPAVAASITAMTMGFMALGAVAGKTQLNAGGSFVATNGNTYHSGPFGNSLWGLAEAAALAVVPFDAKVSLVSVKISANASSSNITIEVRKNGASIGGGRTFTITAGATGVFTDSDTSEIDYAAGDTLSWRMSGQNANVTVTWTGCMIRDPNV